MSAANCIENNFIVHVAKLTFNKYLRLNNNHGVALIIVLLVTALLIALVFEFAYGTRVSLHAAANFRDSQRAYFLARSGINAFVKYPALRDQISQGVFQEVPMISTGDTKVNIMWEDEQGKLSINNIDAPPVGGWIDKLFTDQGVGTDVYNRIIVKKSENRRSFYLITELHTIMKDEDYRKVAQFLTADYTGQKVSLNYASKEVLMSLGCTESSAKAIVELREREGFISDITKIQHYLPATITTNNANFDKPSVYKIYSYATVGGYTKQIEAVLSTGTATVTSVPEPSYWRVL
jgi:type II secretory pathway component PulK